VCLLTTRKKIITRIIFESDNYHGWFIHQFKRRGIGAHLLALALALALAHPSIPSTQTVILRFSLQLKQKTTL
jgi:hypothetical protein